MGFSSGLMIHKRVSSKTQFISCKPSIASGLLTSHSRLCGSTDTFMTSFSITNSYIKSEAVDPVYCLAEWVTRHSFGLLHHSVVRWNNRTNSSDILSCSQRRLLLLLTLVPVDGHRGACSRGQPARGGNTPRTVAVATKAAKETETCEADSD